MAIPKNSDSLYVELLSYDDIYRSLNGVIAMQVAMTTPLKKQKGERDTEFVKRIVAKYVTAAQPTI